MRTFLTERGVLTEELEQEIAGQAEQVAAGLREAMSQEPVIDPLELFDHVYTVQTPQLAAQREVLAEELVRAEQGSATTAEEGQK